MSLDPHLWAALEERGLTIGHLELLLHLLQLQKNGSFAWHFTHGNLVQNDVRIVFGSRSFEMQRVAEVVTGNLRREEI